MVAADKIGQGRLPEEKITQGTTADPPTTKEGLTLKHRPARLYPVAMPTDTIGDRKTIVVRCNRYPCTNSTRADLAPVARNFGPDWEWFGQRCTCRRCGCAFLNCSRCKFEPIPLASQPDHVRESEMQPWSSWLAEPPWGAYLPAKDKNPARSDEVQGHRFGASGEFTVLLAARAERPLNLVAHLWRPGFRSPSGLLPP
jgi:hypothetical protein